MTDRRHFKILKIIYKDPYITFADLKCSYPNYPDIEDIVTELESKHFIEFRCSEDFKDKNCHLYVQSDSHLLSTITGNVLIEEQHTFEKRWFITTFIAVVAALGAYRKELALILQALLQLLT